MPDEDYVVRVNASEGIVEVSGPDRDWVSERLSQLEPVYAGRAPKTADSSHSGSTGKSKSSNKSPAKRKGKSKSGGSGRAHVVDAIKTSMTKEKRDSLKDFLAKREKAFNKNQQNQAAILATFLQDELDHDWNDHNDLYTLYSVMGIDAPGNPSAQLQNATERDKFFSGMTDGKRQLTHKGENFGRTGSLDL